MSATITDPGRTARAVSQSSRANLSAFLGSSIENYDFLLYGSAAALVFGPVFFTGLEPLAATAAALLTFAAGYIARPLGSVVFGHFGDRYGRKRILMLSMVLMGLGSCAIGLIPPPEIIGSWAAVILVALRILQGLAIGGEWGGAALMSIEHASQKQRGFAAAFTNAGSPMGAVLATTVLGLAALLPEDAFLSWGWRIPFLLSAVLLLIGIYVRNQVEESPVFAEQSAETGRPRRMPLVEVLRQPKTVILVVLSCMSGGAVQTLLATYGVGLASRGDLDPSLALFSFAGAQFLAIFTLLAYARLSDRLGRRRVMIGGLAGLVLFMVPALHLLSSGNALLVAVAFLVTGAGLAPAVWGPAAAFIAEQFPTASRYTGASLSFALTLLVAGFTPGIAAALTAADGGTSGVAILMIGMCVVSMAALGLQKESKDRDLRLDH